MFIIYLGDIMTEELEVPLKPLSKKDVHKLEVTLIIATLLREDVFQKIKESTERLTWIDSLAVAAGALARSRAGMTAEQIAEDLGRTEATIRRHLSGKTEAGRLVQETFEKFSREGVRIEFPSALSEEIKTFRRELEEERRKREELEAVLEKVREKVRELSNILNI